MADSRETRRAARRRLAPLYVGDILCRVGLVALPLWGHAGHVGRTWAAALGVALVVGLLLCAAAARRMPAAGAAATPGERAYLRLRRYVRENHPLLYGAEITCWLAFAAAAIWRLFTDRGGAWADGLFAVSMAGVFVCFVLMVRRDPEDRL